MATASASASEGLGPKFSIPTTFKAGVVVNEGPDFHVEVQDVPVPEIKPNEVLIKLNATGLCMTDVHFMMNDWTFPKMSVLPLQFNPQ